MKRDIKFRAWDKSLKRIIYIGDVHNDTSLILDEDSWEVIDHFDGIPTEVLNDENGELMQFIGLKDKNGKEIYEGDIVEFKCIIKERLPIVYDLWSFQPKGWGNIDLRTVEVIGNIYENPELLT